MPSSTTISLIATAVLAAEADFVFTWPYNEDGSCRCEEQEYGIQTFLTEESCLEAFVESEYEYCSYKGRALVEKQCDFAVSVTEGLHNTDCAGKCSEVVAGLLDVSEYMKQCDLEMVVDFGFAVATLAGRCYSNRVFGWSDYDPSSVQKAPLRFFENVATAARCQELCQDVPECASFVWRAVPDHDSTVSFQNEPHTCILYDEEFMYHVTTDSIPSSFGNPTEYCNLPAVGECANIKFPRSKVNILEDQTCLYCGCEARCIYHSDSHVTGPAFCRRGVTDLCNFTRPTWTTTTPEPECPTETCVVPETTTTEAVNTDEGTSVTDVALTTASVVATTTTEAVSPQTTTPALTQMTAESDTALTTTSPVTAPTTGTTPVLTVTVAGTTTASAEETVTTVLLETSTEATELTTTDIVLETSTPEINTESASTTVAATTGPAGASTTGPAEASTTGPAGASTTGPAGASTTGPAGASTTGPAGASTTGPAEASTTGPAGASTTGPAGASTTAPAGASTTGPAGASTTGPAEASTTGPAGASTTAPAGASTTGPAEASTTGPAGASTTGPAGASTTAPAEASTGPAGASTTVSAGETTGVTVTPVGSLEVSTTPSSGLASSTTTSVGATKSVPEGCVPDCPDCPCFVESECDDCYSISDCMDDEC